MAKQALIPAAIVAASFLAHASNPQASAQSFFANLNSDQEVAPGGATNSQGAGSAQLELVDRGGGDFGLDVSITFDDLFNFMNVGGTDNGGATTVTALHIHNADRGANGGVVFGMIGPSSDTDGDFSITNNVDGTTLIMTQWDSGEGNGGADLNDFISDLQNAAPGADVPLYINLHSADDGAGVIRGQIQRIPEPAAAMLLAGALLVGFGLSRRR